MFARLYLDRVVELLLAHESALGQWRVAGDVELGPPLVGRGLRDLGVGLGDLRERLLDLGLTRADLRLGLAQLRLRLKELGPRLVERHLVRPRIDLEQEIASLHHGPLLIVLAHEVAADARTDLRVDGADERPHPLGGDRDVLLDHHFGPDHRRRWRRVGARNIATPASNPPSTTLINESLIDHHCVSSWPRAQCTGRAKVEPRRDSRELRVTVRSTVPGCTFGVRIHTSRAKVAPKRAHSAPKPLVRSLASPGEPRTRK